jgi:hypothetical protein
VRKVLTDSVEYRGRVRKVVLEVDLTSGMISLRLQGCSRRKQYHAKDLYLFGQQLALGL